MFTDLILRVHLYGNICTEAIFPHSVLFPATGSRGDETGMGINWNTG